ncbi:hypothetical protein like AT1G51405 [Hibiscus trionum]|nr:hypothetical protein like AT1G51405 [Hibiscus trionum]
MGTSITRRAKWQYPPPQPTPRIIHLPRRSRRKAPKASPRISKGMMLGSLFDQERSRGGVPVVLVSDDEMRRGRVAAEEEERGSGGGVAFVEEEKWRFQAEMLRAECNLLRMERKIAVKKTERRRVHMERTLKSAAQILLSARKNICEGKDVNMVLLEEQINELMEKIEKLQKRSGVKDLEMNKCSNFDKKVSSLQKQLEKFGLKGISDEEIRVKEIRDMAESSLSIKIRSEDDDHNRNVEDEYSDLSSSSSQQSHKGSVCSGHCKAVVHRIVEQIRAETEQWSQMQDMLGMVRDEMEELHASRDFWEDRALDSDYQIQSLQSAVKEWRQKGLASEAKANELQAQIYVLRQEVERLMQERDGKIVRARIASPMNQEAQNETEKRVLVCRLKEDDPSPKELLRDGRRKPQTCSTGLLPIRRSPLREIGNMSTLKKQQQQQQHGEGTLPLFSLHKEEMKRTN